LQARGISRAKPTIKSVQDDTIPIIL